MDKLIVKHESFNDAGRALYYAIYLDGDARSQRPYRLVAPGAYPKRFKTLKAAQKQFNRISAA